MEKRIKQINFNWRFSQECGEEFEVFTVGNDDVTKIEQIFVGSYEIAYLVSFADGKEQIIFNINRVFYIPQEASNGK